MTTSRPFAELWKRRTMSLADAIRQFVFDEYVEPARRDLLEHLQVRADNDTVGWGLASRMPAVCAALGSKVFEITSVLLWSNV